MKKGIENCAKKLLSEMGIGKIDKRTNNAKGNRTNKKVKKYFFKKSFIPDLPYCWVQSVI